MSDDFKKEAGRQYLKHFRFWFLAAAILLVVTVAAGIAHSIKNNQPRGNENAPEERVYDYADVLTDQEEEELREYIAKKEKQYKADFVIMTFSQAVMGQEAKEKYGYSSTEWEVNMMNIADDFWDENGYGYNKDFEGDGSVLIDNRYPVKGEGGEWLSTSGKVERELGVWDIEEVLYAVDDYYDSSPYRAYRAYIDTVCGYLGNGILQTPGAMGIYLLGALALSFLITAIYVAYHLGKNKAKDTVAPNAYVAGKPNMKESRDDFIRKNVVKRHIETNSGGGGGGRSGGGGGHHVSSGGASHGGGGHRH